MNANFPQSRPLIQAPMEFRLSSGGQSSPQKCLITCPNCGAPTFIRRSERITETVKSTYCHCTNTGCAMTFEVQLVAVRIFSRGVAMRPDLDLPVAAAHEVPHVLPPRGGSDDGDENQISMFSQPEPTDTT